MQAATAGQPQVGLSEKFFPLPTHKDPRLLWPGVSRESQEAVTRLVKQDNAKFHIFFNDEKFHNHLVHHLYAIFALGASPSLLQDAFDLHAEYQRPAFKSPDEITKGNWKDHLNNENYYNAYLHFFADQVEKHGPDQTLERFTVSKYANTPSTKGTTSDKEVNAHMLSRFVSGLVHPLIHAGYGAEFNVNGMLAEGLAMAAVTGANSSALFPPDFFEFDDEKTSPRDAGSSITSTISRLAGVTLTAAPAVDVPVAKHVSALEILKDISKDPTLAAGEACEQKSTNKFIDVLKKKGKYIREKYCARWIVGEGKHGIEKALEEVIWTAVIIYGLGGYREGKDFRSDFFTLHLVTSVFFLPFLVSELKHSHAGQSALLRAHFSVTLGWYISRGRPPLPVKPFFSTSLAEEISQLAPKHLLSVQPNEAALGRGANLPKPIVPIGNPFPSVILSSLHHPEEHLVKLQRALADFDERYGTRPNGYWAHAGEEWAELDGTLFSRVALRSMKALGWVREGEEKGSFSRDGLGWDYLWE